MLLREPEGFERIRRVLEICASSERDWDTVLHCKGGRTLRTSSLLLGLASEFLRNSLLSASAYEEVKNVFLLEFEEDSVSDFLVYVSTGSAKCPSQDRLRNLRELSFTLGLESWNKTEERVVVPNTQSFRTKNSRPRRLDPQTCEYCGKTLSDKHCLKSHINVMHLKSQKLVECPICFKKFKTKGNLKSHSIVHYTGKKEFICDTCGFETKTKLALQLHLETHNSNRRYKCDECDKSFAVKTYLTHHKKTAHSEERPYVCEDCGKSFKLERQVKSHQRLVHYANKNIQCLICSYTCSYMPKMYLHLIVHSGTKPFSCSECSEIFKHKEEGRRHARAKHPLIKVNIKFNMNDVILRLSESSIKRVGDGEQGPVIKDATNNAF